MQPYLGKKGFIISVTNDIMSFNEWKDFEKRLLLMANEVMLLGQKKHIW